MNKQNESKKQKLLDVKSKKGITLIALVITIIILIILAAVTINLTIGDNGLFTTAKRAAKEYKEAQEKELAGLDLFDNTVNDTLEELDGKVVLNGKWSNEKKVNMPKIANTGLTAVTINESETAGISTVSETVETANKDAIPVTGEEQQKESWYSYDTDTRHWANAVSADGSMWVWIPRFAYKITPNADNTDGTIDVVFLKGTTDEPAEKSSEGENVTSDMIIRAKDITDETDLSNKYIVHPAFTDESKTNFENGGWDKEISGFWMAKFEAGYVGEAGNTESAQDSTIKYGNTSTANKNFYGEIQNETLIKYPIFQANRPSVNYIPINDAFDLCISLRNAKNVYDLNNVDSHLTKNSEWGAVAYLAHSKYGRGGIEITINNVSANGTHTIYAITGYGGTSVDAAQITNLNYDDLIAGTAVGNWKEEQGQLASTTGNIYGIYDMSGGLHEWTAGYIETDGNYNIYGGNLKGNSNKYKSKYDYVEDGSDRSKNYYAENNKKRLGEAIWETSTYTSSLSAWHSDISYFINNEKPFTCRGERWGDGKGCGSFSFDNYQGYGYYSIGFRAVLIAD